LGDDVCASIWRAYDELQAEYLAKSVAFRQIAPLSAGNQPTPDRMVVRAKMQELSKWMKERDRIERAFAQRITTLVGDLDATGWQAVVRTARRERTLPFVSAVNHYFAALDYCEVLDSIGIGRNANAIAPIVDDYENQMDDALLSIGSQYPVLMAERMALDEAADLKPAASQEERRRLDIAVSQLLSKPAAINERFVHSIAEALSSSDRKRFESSIRCESSPALCQSDPSELLFARLLATETIPAATRAAIQVIADDYLARRQAIHERLAVELRRSTKLARDSLIGRGPTTPRDTGQQQNKRGEVESWRELYLLAKKARSQIRSLVSEGSLAELPPDIQILLAW
jgi:hypothetical protein